MKHGVTGLNFTASKGFVYSSETNERESSPYTKSSETASIACNSMVFSASFAALKIVHMLLVMTTVASIQQLVDDEHTMNWEESNDCR